MGVDAQTETLTYGAEIEQLMDIVTRSLYSNKDIFMREAISNASDACDKLRYESLGDKALLDSSDSKLQIWIEFNKEQKIIIIRDNGIGMSRQEVMQNLGTIAQSGTKAFRQKLSGDAVKDSQLIGQFGVGFYSAFVVAEKVVVRTRRAGMQPDQGVYWESDGKGQYTIKNIEREQRGTEVILHLREQDDEYLDAARLRHIIHKYSDHILFEILMHKVESATEQSKENEIVIPEYEVVNSAKALWMKPRDQITDEEYNTLYKHISHDFEDPLTWAHHKVEGTTAEYISLLYIPARAPFDLYNRDMQRGIKLYVKRVFIMDNAEQLMPTYLRFVKGVVDSSDLPLNISRELLQSNKTIDRIRSGCVKRVLDTLDKLSKNDAEKYAKFWQEFGAVIKEGPAEDQSNRDRIAKLLRFSSTHHDEEQQSVSLADYRSRMSEKQDKIYYLIADSFMTAKNSPLLEVFRKKGIEVLLMYDRVDEWLVGHLTEFDGKTLQSISQGELDLGVLDDQQSKAENEKKETEF